MLELITIVLLQFANYSSASVATTDSNSATSYSATADHGVGGWGDGHATNVEHGVGGWGDGHATDVEHGVGGWGDGH